MTDEALNRSVRGSVPHEHSWLTVPEGTALTNYVPFMFCITCDREEWLNGVVRAPRCPSPGCECPECQE